MKDYYKILEISRGAVADEIRKSYRKLARKFHPDINKDQGAEEKFKTINEAYEVLKDPEKRKLYDRYGSNWNHMQGQDNRDQAYEYYSGSRGKGNQDYSNMGQGFDFSDLFSNIFTSENSQNFSDNFGGFQTMDQTAEIEIDLADAFFGAERTLALESQAIGPDGRAIPSSKTFKVKIPKGVTNGSIIRLPAIHTASGGATGDLRLKVTIKPHPIFTVKGHDLHTVVNISPWEAALGTKAPVQTVDGTVNLKVAPHAKSREKLRLRGKGIPRKNGAAGDIIVEPRIVIPEKFSVEEEDLLKKLAAASTFDPRAEVPQSCT